MWPGRTFADSCCDAFKLCGAFELVGQATIYLCTRRKPSSTCSNRTMLSREFNGIISLAPAMASSRIVHQSGNLEVFVRVVRRGTSHSALSIACTTSQRDIDIH